MDSIRDVTAIVGVATTDFVPDSGRTEYSMACEVIKAAVDDAGLELADIDGFTKDVVDGIDPMYLQKALGVDCAGYLSESYWGTVPVLNAVTALAAGIVRHVVYYRSANNGSGRRSGSDFRAARETKDNSLDMIRYDFHAPFGLVDQAGQAAMGLRRYYSDTGARPDQVGWVPVVCSEHAATNPHATFCDAPITIEDYLASPMVVDPLRRADVAPETDGAIAVVLTTTERARDLAQPPVVVAAAAQGSATEGEWYSSYGRERLWGLPEMECMAAELFRVAGMGPDDIGVAQLDDRFAPYVPLQLEALGFCGPGEGAGFCAGGDALRVGGRLALNTNGGFLGEGFAYGANVIEAVRQIRGTAVNQVPGAEVVLVASGAGGPADGLLLRRA